MWVLEGKVAAVTFIWWWGAMVAVHGCWVTCGAGNNVMLQIAGA